MANDGLFSSENKSFNPNENKIGKTIGGNDKGVKDKLKKIGKDFGDDVVESATNLATGVANSVRDAFTLSGQRNGIVDGIEYGAKEVSIANRHRDAISSILDKTFSGNLFDAGVSTLSLLNNGSKWKMMYKTEVDKDIYPFKYLYYYNPLYGDESKKSSNRKGKELNVNSNVGLRFLEDIEDPTILGFNIKIDYLNSPLFSYTQETTPEESGNKNGANRNEGEQDGVTKQPRRKQPKKVKPGTEYSARNFLEKYQPQHPEMGYCKLYLDEFQEICEKVFVSPEFLNTEFENYNTMKYKNSYIYSINGLEKLDNPFVKYKEDVTEHEKLEFLLGEDIRMYINRMAFLYRNLTWSYNMGKKLIPENMLRFNLYIKISDIRNYTSGVKKDNSEVEDSNTLVDAIRNGYSRVIYELKDCEFLFDTSLNPSELKMGGDSVNESYANLKFSIKYRKVNRIFYSKLFSPNFADFLIGDKFYTPDTTKALEDLNGIGFGGDIKKRKSMSNNIDVYPSLKTRLDVLKNKGLLNEDDNDTALTRFGKSIGNKAVRAGATVLDDGMQELKNSVNSFGKNVFNNNFSSTVRDLLKDKVQTKSKILGKSLHLNTGKQFSDMGEVVNFTSTNLSTVDIVNEDLHPLIDKNLIQPNEDLHPLSDKNPIQPNEDLHPLSDKNHIQPNEDLHPLSDKTLIQPNEDLHPLSNKNLAEPNEDLHPLIDKNPIQPNEDLHPLSDKTLIQPNEDLHPLSNKNLAEPNEDLHNESNKKIKDPNGNVNIGSFSKFVRKPQDPPQDLTGSNE